MSHISEFLELPLCHIQESLSNMQSLLLDTYVSFVFIFVTNYFLTYNYTITFGSLLSPFIEHEKENLFYRVIISPREISMYVCMFVWCGHFKNAS